MDMVVNILVSFVLCVCFIWGSAWRSWCEKERKSLGFNFFFFLLREAAYLILDFLSCLGSREFTQFFFPPRIQQTSKARRLLFSLACLPLKLVGRLEKKFEFKKNSSFLAVLFPNASLLQSSSLFTYSLRYTQIVFARVNTLTQRNTTRGKRHYLKSRRRDIIFYAPQKRKNL